MILFIVSLLLGIFTVLIIQIKLGFDKNKIFFSFFPFLFVYLGLISIVLSFGSLLTGFAFLLTQFLFALSVLKFCGLPRLAGLKKVLKSDLVESNELFRTKKINRLLIIFILTLLIITSFLKRYYKPIVDYDDKAYRASAPLYWVQHKSVFRFETIDERKNTILYGSGLIYMWPNLFHTGERFANIFYWTGFPVSVLAIFIFSGFFTNNVSLRLFSALLFLGTPTVYGYLNNSLSQEMWLGLTLISSTYFLFKSLESKKTSLSSLTIFGICLGASVFIKTTSAVYLLLTIPLFIFLPDKPGVFLKTFVGFSVAFILSGFVIILFQNYKIYGSVTGSKYYYSEYINSGNSENIITQLKRVPFTFLEFPLFSKIFSENFSRWLDRYAKASGADNLLRDEDKQWIGGYKYSLESPNKFLGIGGLIWLITEIAVVYSYLKNHNNQKVSKVHLTFILIFSASLIIMTYIRWIESAGVPYRHLISGYALACCFLTFYAEHFSIFSSKIFRLVFFGIVIATSIEQLAFFSGYSTYKPGIPQWQTDQTRKSLLYDPFTVFLPYVKKQTSYILVDSVNLNLPDYPFFWIDGQNSNKVYLFNHRFYISNEINNQALLKMFNEVQPEFLIISSVQNYNSLSPEGEILGKMEHIITFDSHNLKTEIYQNKSNQINQVDRLPKI